MGTLEGDGGRWKKKYTNKFAYMRFILYLCNGIDVNVNANANIKR